MSGKLKRLCEVCSICFFKLVLSLIFCGYICLIVFSGMAVQYHRKSELNTCGLPPISFGGLVFGFYVGLTLQLLFMIIQNEVNKDCGDNHSNNNIESESKNEIQSDNFKRMCLVSLFPGTFQSIIGAIIMNYTIFSPCFYNQYVGTFVIPTCYAIMSICMIMSIFTIIGAILSSYICFSNFFSTLWNYYADPNISFKIKILNVIRACIVLTMIISLILTGITINKYATDYHKDTDNRCAITPTKFGFLFFGTCAIGIVGMIVVVNNLYMFINDGYQSIKCKLNVIINSDKSIKEKKTDIEEFKLLLIMPTLFLIIVCSGFTILIVTFSYYTWYSKCFLELYGKNTIVMSSIIIVSINATIPDVYSIFIIGECLLVLAYLYCKDTYEYVMYGNNNDTQQINVIPNDIVNPINNTNIKIITESLIHDDNT